jgi:hypothetical protein
MADFNKTPAYIWCKKARDILKLKETGTIKDSQKDSFYYKRFDAALKSINKNLTALLKLDPIVGGSFADTFKDEYFKDITDFESNKKVKDKDKKAKQEEVSKSLNVESSTAMAFRLEEFNLALQVALGKFKPEELTKLGVTSLTLDEADQINSKLELEEQSHYIDAYQDARRICDDLKTLKATVAYGLVHKPFEHRFDQAATTHLDDAKKAYDPAGEPQPRDKLNEAMEHLGKVLVVAAQERERHTTFLKFRLKLTPFQALEQELIFADKATGKSLSGDTSTQLNVVRNNAIAGDFARAEELLKYVQKSHDEAYKKFDSTDKKKIAEFKSEREKFEKEYTELVTLVGKALRLPGADIGELKTLLDLLQSNLQSARRDADGAKSYAEALNANSILRGVRQSLETAGKLSEKAIETAKQDDKAIKPWLKLKRAAEIALKSLASVPAAVEEYAALNVLIRGAEAKITIGAVVSVGYAAALEHLKDYETIVARAKQKQETAEKTQIPSELKNDVAEADNAVLLYSNSASSYLAAFKDEALKVLLADLKLKFSKTDLTNEAKTKLVEESKKQLSKFVTDTNQETNALLKEEQELSQSIQQLESELQSLEVKKVPAELLSGAKRIIHTVENEDVIDREWAGGKSRIDRAALALKKTVESYEANKGPWEKASTRLAEIKKFAEQTAKWPALTTKSQLVIARCLQVEETFAQTRDFAGYVKDFNAKDFGDKQVEEGVENLTLEERYEALKKGAKDIPNNAEDLVKLVAKAGKPIMSRLSDYDTLLNELEAKMVGVVDRSGTDYHKKRNEMFQMWNTYLQENYFGYDPSKKKTVDDKSIREKVKEVLETIIIETNKLKKVLEGGTDLNNVIETAKKKKLSPAAQVAKLLESLRLLGATGFEKQRDEYFEQMKRKLPDDKGDELHRDGILTEIAKDLQQRLNMAQTSKHFRVREAKQLRQNLVGSVERLKELKGENLTFATYRETLEREVEDIEAMIASDDAELLGIANKKIGELKKKIDRFDPKAQKPTDPNEKTFAMVEARIEEIGVLLGTESGSVGSKEKVIKKQYPETYADLDKKYNAAILIAQSSEPSIGLAALDPLEEPILAAVHKAKLKSDKCTIMKERIVTAKSLMSKVKEKTSTKVTEKAGRVEDFVATRLERAEEVMKTENGIADADELIRQVEELLNGILNAPDQRQALFEQDGRMRQEKDLIIRMAKQFSKELSSFTGKILEKARDRLKEREANDEIRKADLEDSLQSIKGIENTVSVIKKIVKPYTANLDTLTYDADKAPDLKQATSDFERARRMLNDAIAATQRIVNGTATINVNISEDFGKVQKTWSDQATAFRTAMTSAASAIDEIAEAAKDAENPLHNFKDDISKSAAKAKKMVEDLSRRFRVDAFAKGFDILGQSTKGVKDQEGTARKRDAAREDVLLTMRQYRTDLLGDPVLRKLLEKRNPFARPQVASAYGYLKAALKRVEIETLIGV